MTDQPCIPGIDPGLSGGITLPRSHKGKSRLNPGQFWSDRYEGHIDCGDGIFREPFLSRSKSTNRYKREIACTTCGAIHLQNLHNSKTTRNAFCSKRCKELFIKSNTVGRRSIKKRQHGSGYHVLIKTYEHPRGGRHHNVYEHILVAEKAAGRFLSIEERVHHIDMIKNNNEIENLVICANDTEHFRIHGSLNQCVAELIRKGVLRFDHKEMVYRVVESNS